LAGIIQSKVITCGMGYTTNNFKNVEGTIAMFKHNHARIGTYMGVEQTDLNIPCHNGNIASNNHIMVMLV